MQFQDPEWMMIDSKRKNVPTIVKMGPFGRDKVYELINKGLVESKVVDGRRLVKTPSYKRYIAEGGRNEIPLPWAREGRRNFTKRV